MTSTGQHDTFVQFAAVDQSADPNHFFTILDLVRQSPGMAESRGALHAGLALKPGQRVLDAGCGLGWDTIEFARAVGPSGEAVGIDLSAAMVEEATRRAEGLGLPIRFATGDIMKLDFPDESFDACRTERCLIYVPDAGQAIAEMVRVTKPGGRIGIVDVDFETVVIDHPDPEMSRRVTDAARDALIDGRLGRKMPRLLREAGLRDVTMSGHTIFLPTLELNEVVFTGNLAAAVGRGELSEEQVARWWQQLRDMAAAGPLASCLTFFVASATRP